MALAVTPAYILNTHHHFDHTEGNLELKELYGAQIVGAAKDAHRIPGIDITVEDGGNFKLGDSKAEIIAVPGHTTGHILWYFPTAKRFLPAICCLISALAAYLKARPNKCGNQF